MSAWKQFERECGDLIGGARYWANAGESVDFESSYAFGQAKLRKNLSLNEVTKLAESLALDPRARVKLPLVCCKVRRGCGVKSQPVVVMTFETFKQWFDLNKEKP